MPANRKLYRHNDCLLVTSRTEEGLPFVPTSVMNLLIWGILAKARSMYQVKICHMLFMANHFHMILVVDNPEHVSEFLRYVKSESAHAVNRLLGRRRKTIWNQGSDSPILLTADDVVRYIAYIYLNPTKANLVERIESYPGISTWQMFFTERTRKIFKKIPRSKIALLGVPSLTIREQDDVLREYIDIECTSYELVVEPFAWVECFENLSEVSLEAIKAEIIKAVREGEREISARRLSEGRSVAGATALKRQSMLKEYTPKKFSKKMICLCSDICLRKEFISFYRSLCELGKDAYERWKRGELRYSMPAGLVSPRVPSLVSAIT